MIIITIMVLLVQVLLVLPLHFVSSRHAVTGYERLITVALHHGKPVDFMRTMRYSILRNIRFSPHFKEVRETQASNPPH